MDLPIPIEIAGVEELKRLIRDVSLDRMSSHTQLQDLRIQAIEDERPVLAHWMVLMLISSEPFRMNFNAHFMSREAGKFASAVYRVPSSELTDVQTFDFMREYSNLAAGTIKRFFEGQGLTVGVSLPLLVRGFDWLYLKSSENTGLILDEWRILHGDATVFCSLLVNVHNEKSFSKLSFEQALPIMEEGEVRFL